MHFGLVRLGLKPRLGVLCFALGGLHRANRRVHLTHYRRVQSLVLLLPPLLQAFEILLDFLLLNLLSAQLLDFYRLLLLDLEEQPLLGSASFFELVFDVLDGASAVDLLLVVLDDGLDPQQLSLIPQGVDVDVVQIR